jgi:hypothetical protein
MRGIVAVASAVVVVLVAGIVGARARTEPDELACEFVAVSANETGGTSPTAIAAAAEFAAGVLGADPSRIETDGGVVEVSGSATFSGGTGDGTVFAIRDQGRTVGLLTVHGDVGGWAVGRVELC